MMTADDNTQLGRVSLWLSILGLVLPVTFFVLAFAFVAVGYDGLAYFIYAVILAAVMELVAFGCGVAARRTKAGRIAVWVSSGVFGLAVLLAIWFFVMLSHTRIP